MSDAPDQRDAIELRIDSDPKYLCVARAVVGVVAERLGLDEAACGKVSLAVDEAVTNVIRHGYGGATDQPIWLKVQLHDGNGQTGFTLIVEDRGRQVDPRTIRGRDLADVRPGGLGVHIIQEVMDQVSYSRREDGGMRLVMSKNTGAAGTQSGTKPKASTS